MRGHSTNELRYRATLLAPDGTTSLAEGIACGLDDLSGRRLEQAQLQAAETTHMILMRAGDASILPPQGYVTVDVTGLLYVVDYMSDPREPRAGMWTEVYCHVERSGN